MKGFGLLAVLSTCQELRHRNFLQKQLLSGAQPETAAPQDERIVLVRGAPSPQGNQHIPRVLSSLYDLSGPRAVSFHFQDPTPSAGSFPTGSLFEHPSTRRAGLFAWALAVGRMSQRLNVLKCRALPHLSRAG